MTDYHGIILKLKDRYPANSTKFHVELMKEAVRQDRDRIMGNLATVVFDRAVEWIGKNHMQDLDIEVVRDEIMDTTPIYTALEDVVMSILEDNQKSLEFEHYDARANSEEYRKHIKGEAEIDDYLARR